MLDFGWIWMGEPYSTYVCDIVSRLAGRFHSINLESVELIHLQPKMTYSYRQSGACSDSSAGDDKLVVHEMEAGGNQQQILITQI